MYALCDYDVIVTSQRRFLNIFHDFRKIFCLLTSFVVWCLAQVCQTQGVDHISNDGLSINAHLASYYIATWVCRGEEGSNPVSLPLVFFMAYIKTSTAGPRPAPRATGTLRFTAE